MISESELRKEKDYLRAVLYILEKEILAKTEWKKVREEDTLQSMKYIWDNQILARDDEQEKLYQTDQISRMVTATELAEQDIKTYTRMLKSAYFARIDFDDGEEVLPVYIGVASLESGGNFYVYDWRAPIASMFYDYELGDAEYKLPDGNKIDGKIILKRQYKIDGDKIEQIFDTDLQIIDNVLKDILGDKTATKMKNIVKSIQKEQNKVIRMRDADILVVQGPAGSGKTSVGMHRIAYLLYAEKDTLKYSNILIVSPNDIFSDYISSVLPEIGEENVYQTTFMDYVKYDIKEFKIKNDMCDIYEELYSVPSNKPTVFYNSIKLKFSASYVNFIERFLQKKRYEILGVKDIVVDNVVLIDKQFLEKFAQDLDKTSMSLFVQSEKMCEKIMTHLDIKLYHDKKGKAKIKKALKDALKDIKIKDLYQEIFSNKEAFVQEIIDIYNETGVNKNGRLTIKELGDVFDYTTSSLQKGFLPYEDVSIYMYLKDRVFGNKAHSDIKYVVIDEAQDYTILQYRILADLFRGAKITLLGDLNQSIMPFAMHSGYESIINTFKEERILPRVETSYLTKTYRSTSEINEWTKKILGESATYNQIDRHGDAVKIIKDDANRANSKMIKDAIALKKQYNSVAIIFKTSAEVQEFKKDLENLKIKGFNCITKNDRLFDSSKIMVLPSYIAKGLEFDAVLVADANKKTYSKEFKNLFYVVCTRALHKLNVYYTTEYCDLENC